MGKWRLYVDQYGQCIGASTLTELRKRAGGGSAAKVYCDDKDGKSWHVGYLIGRRYFTAYLPDRLSARPMGR